MPGDPTSRYGIATMLGSDLGSTIDDTHNAAMATIDAKMVGYSEGPLTSRPVSTPQVPGIAGREYRATDTGQVFKDTGTSWTEIIHAADNSASKTGRLRGRVNSDGTRAGGSPGWTSTAIETGHYRINYGMQFAGTVSVVVTPDNATFFDALGAHQAPVVASVAPPNSDSVDVYLWDLSADAHPGAFSFTVDG